MFGRLGGWPRHPMAPQRIVASWRRPGARGAVNGLPSPESLREELGVTLRTCLLTKSGRDRTSELTTGLCLTEVALRHSELLALRIERPVLKAPRPTFGMGDGQRELTPTVPTGFDSDSGAAVTTDHSPHRVR